MDRDGEIARRKKLAAEVSVAPKEKLTWDVSAYVRKWVHGMFASLIILCMACGFIIVLFLFVVGLIRAVSAGSEYPLTAVALVLLAVLVGAKTLRSYRLMQGTQSM